MQAIKTKALYHKITGWNPKQKVALDSTLQQLSEEGLLKYKAIISCLHRKAMIRFIYIDSQYYTFLV